MLMQTPLAMFGFKTGNQIGVFSELVIKYINKIAVIIKSVHQKKANT